MEVTIYTDILFGWNYLMDLQILFLTAIFSRIPWKIGRISIAAGLLALYGTIAFVPDLEMLFSLLGRVLASSLAVFLLIFPGTWRSFFKSLCVFYLVSAGIGGVIFALMMGTHLGGVLRAVAIDGQVYLNLDFRLLLLGIGFSYSLFLHFRRIAIRNFSRDKILAKVSFTVAGKQVSVTTLLDTGCELTAPITGEGVLLISASVLGNTKIEKSFLLPVHTAGGDGMLQAFYPDAIACQDTRYQMAEIPLIAISQGSFATDGLYQSICNPKILQEKNQDGGREDDRKIQRICKTLVAGGAASVGKPAGEKRCLLYRRQRNPAGTSWQRRRGEVAPGTEQPGNLPESPADPNREKSAVGGLHSQKI